jgi:hypothetical protein
MFGECRDKLRGCKLSALDLLKSLQGTVGIPARLDTLEVYSSAEEGAKKALWQGAAFEREAL